MYKKIKKIIIILLGLFIFYSSIPTTNIMYASNSTQNENTQKDLNINNPVGKGKENKNEVFNNFRSERHMKAAITGEKGVKNTLYNIARDLKNIFFVIATIYLLIIVIRIIFSENSEEEFSKFKKGVVWTTIGIVIMQLAFSFVNLNFGQEINAGFALRILQTTVNPLLKLIETAASFVFIAIAIYSFYRMITANGDDEKAKSGKTSIIYAIIGFIIVQFARRIVHVVYSKTYCKSILSDSNSLGKTCTDRDINEGAGLIFKIINWMNSFIGIAIVLIIIYIGAQIIFSNGDEEKIKTAKSSLLYVVIGVFILIVNYLILTFFLVDTLTKA